MTDQINTAEKTEPISQEVKSYIEVNIHILQQARLDKRRNTTLEDVFKGRNPYFLRGTRKAVWELVQCCLEHYLLSVDEMLFAKFVNEFTAFAAKRGQQLPQSDTMFELFPLDDLPLRHVLLEENVRLYNRLTYRFYEELCVEEPLADWQLLSRFISECESNEISQEAVDDSA